MALTLGLLGGAGQAETADIAATKSPRIEMKGNLLSFNGQPLRFEDRVETWTQTLGPPSSAESTRYRWYGEGLEVWVNRSADGRSYVKTMIVRLGAQGYPGEFILQGVVIRHGAPAFSAVTAALAQSQTPLIGLGRGLSPESGRMKARGPDGFDVVVSARLACPKPPPRGNNELCEQFIDELELGSSW